MTEFTVKLLILGLPGIICYFLWQKLIGRREKTTVEVILYVFVYTILAYMLVYAYESLVYFAVGGQFDSQAKTILLGEDWEVTPQLMLRAICAGVVLAYLLAYCVRYNIANRLGQRIRATQRYGDEDVWHYFHNAPQDQKNEGWVMVRDLKTDLTYHCYISVWSESGMDRELVLSDVSVYSSSTAEYLYDAQHIYLSRARDELTIEVPPHDAEQDEAYIKTKEDVKEQGNE